MQHHLVPHFILEKHAAGINNGRFSGIVLFVDTSGFTPLTAQLQTYGTSGAEILANVLLSVFEPIIDTIYANGGFIAGFAGDACKAVFPGTDQPTYLAALAAARDIRQHMDQHATYATPYGDFPFAVRSSIADGIIDWNIWQTESVEEIEQHAVYTFGGEAIDDAIQGEALAQAGEIIISQSVLKTVEAWDGLETTPLVDSDEYWRVTTIPDTHPPTQPADPYEMAPLTAVTPFYPTNLITHASQGEFRRVLTLFINLQSLPTHAEDPFITTFFRLLHQYEGYLCRLGRIGSLDAGGTLLLFWGAPTSHENDVERVLNFVLDLKAQTAVPFRAGITYQIVYAGFIGSPRREEYTCYGLSVNLAARLMTSAPWGTVWVDEAVAQRAEAIFRLDDLEERLFKGFDQPLPVYQLRRRRLTLSDPFFRGNIVGRQRELDQLTTSFSPLENGRFGGVVTISGEAGIGKSRLLHEFLNQADILEEGEWFLCQTDEILREPLNPFRYFLHHYFEQVPKAGEATNKAQFDVILDYLIDETPDLELQAELHRTRSFLGALVDLHWKDSLHDQSEPKLRQENTFIALKSLIKAESLRQPVILQIEDAHWLDESSRRFLAVLTRNVADFPFVVLVTTRDQALDSPLAPDVPQQIIQLQSLNDTEIVFLAENRLGTKISPKLVPLLQERTDGNPFFVEQLVVYLQEQQLLKESAEGVELETAVSTLPSDLQAILVARIDKLTHEVRQVVQTAAVLGREFDVQVLSHMLRGETSLPEKVQSAESAAIWSALSELRYLFKHALLRDAAYDMQLQAQRRQLHQIAAEAIRQLFSDDLTSYYTDLTYHYRQAGRPREEAQYAQLAGETAAEQYANTEALRYLSRALELTAESNYETRFELLSAKVQIFDLLGRRDEQAADIEQMRVIAHNNEAELQNIKQIQVALAQAKLFQMLGDATRGEGEVTTAVNLAQQSQNIKLEAESHISLAATLWKLGRYDEARHHARTTLSLARENGLPVLEARALMQLGNQDFLQEKHESATDYYQQALTAFRNLKDKRGEAATLFNLSLIAKFESPAQAEAYMTEGRNIYRQMGDQQGITKSFTGAAIFQRYQGNYEKALEDSQQGLALSLEIGDRDSEMVAISCIADSSRHLGDYATAARNFEECIRLAQELGDPRMHCFFHILNGILLYLQGASQQAIESEAAAVELAQAHGITGSQAIALTFLGHALVEADQWEEAETVYQEALTIQETLTEPKNHMELLAGMARLAQLKGDLDQAYEHVLEVIRLLTENDVKGVEEPALVYITCYEILREQENGRSSDILQAGYDLLQERASLITDPQRRQLFLEGIATHRKLESLYAASQQSDNNR